MDVSSASSSTASVSTTVAIEVQKKTQDIQKQTADTLMGSLPDPTSAVGQNIDVKA